MRGAVNLTFEREPHYHLGSNLAGARDETIVAYAGERLVCMGRCSVRDCWIDGHAVRAGYLAELRLDSQARGQFAILRHGYRFFRDRQGATTAKIYFTSIAADNERARLLLESGARGLPNYTYLADLVTLLIAVPRRVRPSVHPLQIATAAQLPEFVDLLNQHGRRHQLATCWRQETLPNAPLIAFSEGGKMQAGGILWDHRGFRQTVVQGYRPMLSALRPALNALGGLFGLAPLPRPGRALAHAFLSPFGFAPGADSLLSDFVAASMSLASRQGLEFLTMALPASDPRLATLQERFHTRAYRSRLYRVDWQDSIALELNDPTRPFLPEVAFL
jgi:hypothetical protein